MTEAMGNAGTVCGVVIVTELLVRLCPKNKMLGFVQALTVLVLLVSLAGALLRADWRLLEPEPTEGWQNQELNEYVEDQYKQAAQKEAESYLKGLLAAAGLEAKKIVVDIDITDGSSIVLTRAAVVFRYESDAQRARALLQSALGDGIAIEVTADGA